MKKVALFAAIAGAAIAMTGCSTMSSDPVQVQPGVYTLTGENWGTYDSGVVRLDLIKKGTEFCTKKGKQFYLLDGSQSDAVMYGKTATAVINFKCVD